MQMYFVALMYLHQYIQHVRSRQPITIHFTPHCSTTYVDVACCYRPCSMVCRSITIIITAKTTEYAVWGLDLAGSRKPCVRWGCPLTQPGKYNWTLHVSQWCGFLLNYFEHLLLLCAWHCLLQQRSRPYTVHTFSSWCKMWLTHCKLRAAITPH